MKRRKKIPFIIIFVSLGIIALSGYLNAKKEGFLISDNRNSVRNIMVDSVDAQTVSVSADDVTALPVRTNNNYTKDVELKRYDDKAGAPASQPVITTNTSTDIPTKSITDSTVIPAINPVGTSVDAEPNPVIQKEVSTTKSTTKSDSVSSSDTNSETGRVMVKYVAPLIEEPKEGAKYVGSDVQFSVRAAGAVSVEFFYRQVNAGLDATKYLKKATYAQNGVWKLSFPASNLPNGNYELIARSYLGSGGTLETDPVHFAISLPVISSQIAKEPNKEFEDASVDTDGDGIFDNEEKRLGTNPNNPDSDQDGYLDGDEIKSGYDPIKPSFGNKEDKVVFQNPKEVGDLDERYLVKNVSMIDIEQTGNLQQQKVLRIDGRALPNMFVTLYIYSDSPVVVTVRTDADGNWSYDLDKNLENGEHQIYVAVTDNTGKITAKSQPLNFVKTAEAATVVASMGDNGVGKVAPPMMQKKNAYLSIALIIMAVFLSVALLLIGVVAYRHQSDEAHH